MNDNLKNPDTLTDEQLLGQTRSLAQAEKGATLALLEYLNAVDARRAYAIGAYSSLFDYVVRGLGYSEAQASERVNAVRLMTQNPEVKLHLQSGAMNLTIAAQVQRFISQE
ncbi:MAG: hypothetical protein EBX52_03315, partial [Proteobacteria bacterium]|nr:hypothetical protein [Pseudomonadota bacterium]